MKAMYALSLIAAAGAAASAAPELQVMPSEVGQRTVKEVRRIYINAATGERVILLDSVSPRAADEDQWINEETNSCGDGSTTFWSGIMNNPAPQVFLDNGWAYNFQIRQFGDVPFDTMIDQLSLSWASNYGPARDPDSSTPSDEAIEGNNLVFGLIQGDDGFADSLQAPVAALTLEDIPGDDEDDGDDGNAVVYTGTVDLDGLPFIIEVGDTDDITNTNNTNVPASDVVHYAASDLLADLGIDASEMDRDPIFYGPGAGPGDGLVDLSITQHFEQPGVVLGDESTYDMVVDQGIFLAGPTNADEFVDGFNNDGYDLPGHEALYDAFDNYGFDADGDPFQLAAYSVTLWFGGFSCATGTPHASYYAGLRGPVQFDYTTPTDCVPDVAPAGAPDGVLNIDDVLLYLNLFAASDPDADIAPAGAPDGLLNIDDVLLFLNLFAAGCP